MAFLKFRIGSNNYELRDVTDCHIFGGEYYKSLTETSRVYDLILTSNKKNDYVVGQILGDVCNIDSLNTSKMIFVELENGYSTITDQMAMEYAIQYLNNKKYKKL